MALIKWEPRQGMPTHFGGLRQEIDRVFDDFFRGWPRPFAGAWTAPFEETGAPAVDLKETEKELVLVATVPGVEKDQLKVNIQEDSVTIEGERREEKEAKGENYHWREAAYGSFRRVVPLPTSVLADKAKAKLKDGVLTLNLPKAAPSKRKQIEIKVE